MPVHWTFIKRLHNRRLLVMTRSVRFRVSLPSALRSRLHLSQEPDPRQGPVSLNGSWRHLQDVRDLFNGKTAEIA